MSPLVMFGGLDFNLFVMKQKNLNSLFGVEMLHQLPPSGKLQEL
jgi:hypothetical protein